MDFATMEMWEMMAVCVAQTIGADSPLFSIAYEAELGDETAPERFQAALGDLGVVQQGLLIKALEEARRNPELTVLLHRLKYHA